MVINTLCTYYRIVLECTCSMEYGICKSALGRLVEVLDFKLVLKQYTV